MLRIILLREFSYNPGKGIMFAVYFRRYEDVFRKGSEWIDKKKSTSLQKLNAAIHDRYCNHILPRKQGEVSFDKTANSYEHF